MGNRKKLLLIYTGGTIGMIREAVDGPYVPFDFEGIGDQFPELNRLACDIEVRSFKTPRDSSSIGPEIWIEIAQYIQKVYTEFDGFVILHGTDTMAYTGSALSFILEGLSKPVILTGSQLPINEIRTDAKENMVTAIEIASHPDMPIREVGLYFEYKLFRANRSKKVHADKFAAFDSPNFPELVQAGVHLRIRRSTPKDAFASSYFQVQEKLETNIGHAMFYPGVTADTLSSVLLNPNNKGIILQSYGTGNMPSRNKALVDLVKESAKQGKVILNITQCTGGFVEMGRYEASEDLVASGVLGGADLTFEAALTKMMYLMGKYEDLDKVRYYLERNIRGEMTAERAYTN